MIRRLVVSPVIAGVFALSALAASPAAAADVCASFPDVPWWGNMSHKRVTQYVERKHDGDWTPYIAKWERQKSKLEKVLAKGSSVVIKKHGVRLRDGDLADYIEHVDDRLKITRCLAQQQASRQTTDDTDRRS